MPTSRNPRVLSRRTILIASSLHSLLSIAVVPGVQLWVAALVSVAPLAWLADALASAKSRAISAALPTPPNTKSRVLHTLGIFSLIWAPCLFKELVHHWWVLQITPWGLPPLLAIMACWPALFVLLLATVRQWLPRIPLAAGAAALWVFIELFRGEIFAGGYRWGLLAMPIVHAPFIRDAGSVLGVYGVGALLAATGGAAATVLRDRDRGVCGPHSLIALGVVLALLGAVAVAGRLGIGSTNMQTPNSLRVTLLQTNIPSDNKVAWTIEDQINDFLRFDDILAYSNASNQGDLKPDLIMWPETMAPGGPIHPDVTAVFRKDDVVIGLDKTKTNGLEAMGMWEWAEQLGKQQAALGSPVLIGDDVPIGFRAILSDKQWDFKYDQRFNSMLLIDKGEVTRTRYDKILRTPFGEYMPIIGRFPWLKKKLTTLAAPGMSLDLSAGSAFTRFEIPFNLHRPTQTQGLATLATPICFEITSPTLCRDLAFENGARMVNVLANPTNDGWFGDSSMGKRMHLEHAQWRSLELGTFMVRPANTGLSCLIDDKGQVATMGVWHPVVGKGTSFVSPGNNTDGWLTVDAPLATGSTVYAKLGNGPAWALGLAGLALAVASLLVKLRNRS